MPQFIELQRKDEKKEGGKKDYYKRTKEAIGYSLIGSWFKKMFSCDKVNIIINITALQENDNLKSDVDNPLEIILRVFTLSACASNEHLEVLENNDNYTINAKIDPTAFVFNSFRFENVVKNNEILQIENTPMKLCDFLRDLFGETLLEESIKTYLKVGSLESNNFEKVVNNYCSNITQDSKFPLFLLKHTDMTYNVIKRVIRQMLYISDSVVRAHNYKSSVKHKKPDNPACIIHDFYERLYKELENQDKVYYTTKKANDVGFATTFAKNPVVRLFYDICDENGNIKEDDTENIGSLVKLINEDNPWIRLEKYSKPG